MDKPESPFGAFDWAGAQQRFLDAVTAFGGGQQAQPPNPWQKAMEFWWQGAQAAVPDRDRAVYENLLGQSRAFYAVTEHFSKLLAAISSAQGAQDWESMLKQHMEAWKAQAAAADDPALRGLLAAWQLPVDTWQRTLNLLSVSSGGTPGAAVPGFTREFQEQIGEGARLWDEYQRALQEYRNVLSGVAVDALNRLQIRILAVGASGKSLTTLREIFDLWIECSEAAYSERAFTEDYAQCFGRLVNTLMAFKRHGQELVDEGLSAANLPTRQGMNSIQRSQRDMRRDLEAAAAQGAANAESLSQIRQELESLRQELSGTAGAATGGRAPRPSAGDAGDAGQGSQDDGDGQ